MEKQESNKPVLSITIPLAGEPYRRAIAAMRALAEATGEMPRFLPHVTLQQVYDETDPDVVASSLYNIAQRIEPFNLQVSGLGVLSTPGERELWHLHLHVRKCEEILQVYELITSDLQERGLRTYPYTQDNWIPHLTLASGCFSKKKIKGLIKKIEEVPTSLSLVVENIDLHGLREDGRRWSLLRRIPLGNGKSEFRAA